jgi:hypothetical protein
VSVAPTDRCPGSKVGSAATIRPARRAGILACRFMGHPAPCSLRDHDRRQDAAGTGRLEALPYVKHIRAPVGTREGALCFPILPAVPAVNVMAKRSLQGWSP